MFSANVIGLNIEVSINGLWLTNVIEEVGQSKWKSL